MSKITFGQSLGTINELNRTFEHKIDINKEPSLEIGSNPLDS